MGRGDRHRSFVRYYLPLRPILVATTTAFNNVAEELDSPRFSRGITSLETPSRIPKQSAKRPARPGSRLIDHVAWTEADLAPYIKGIAGPTNPGRRSANITCRHRPTNGAAGAGSRWPRITQNASPTSSAAQICGPAMSQLPRTLTLYLHSSYGGLHTHLFVHSRSRSTNLHLAGLAAAASRRQGP